MEPPFEVLYAHKLIWYLCKPHPFRSLYEKNPAPLPEAAYGPEFVGVVVEASDESLVTANDAPPTQSELNKSKCRGQCRHAPACMNY
jgi:hypothetical protein